MITLSPPTFSAAYRSLSSILKVAPEVPNPRWQGTNVAENPAAVMHEVRHVVLEVDLGGVEDLDRWRVDVSPNLPWADDHFSERVGGEPLNPGVEWANWPWGVSAAKFRDRNELFNHTYMERLWPRWARRTPGGRFTDDDPCPSERQDEGIRGIGGRYGDLDDLVDLLVAEPYTRQAWIPLFFPEDTGVGDGGRKPCTLGYQFLVRDGRIHVWYPLRSCDLVHHWRDDCYLAVRLLLWVLGRCREQDPGFWDQIRPGTYGMHMTSLHVFTNDRRKL